MAYRATDGKELWSIGSADRRGRGGLELRDRWRAVHRAKPVGFGLARYGASNQSRLLVFKLDGTTSLPPGAATTAAAGAQSAGADGFGDHHRAGASEVSDQLRGVPQTPYANRGVFPDLRYSPMINTPEAFRSVVLDGVLQADRGWRRSRATDAR